MAEDHLPLAGLLVVDLSQFLAGPYAALRLQDLGARVIKVERPDGGDLSRRLYLSDTVIDGESTIFHAINRGKESLALDLKAPGDAAVLRGLLARADVLIQNFRPGVVERLGFGAEAVRALSPRIVYASISGYGPDGAWSRFPGQDLLAQARSGAMWLSGSEGDGPVPFGLSVADMFAGATLAHGVLAALVRRGITGAGSLVETSLIEAMLDMQFEALATFMNDGGRPPRRAAFRSAHAGLAAPYGVYATADGWLALAMTPLDRLAEVLDAPDLLPFAAEAGAGFVRRDEIKRLVAAHLAERTTADWLAALEPRDVWCAEVLDWPRMLASEAIRDLDMVQDLPLRGTSRLRLMRSPLRIDGERARSEASAPAIGQHSAAIRAEFAL